jgi:hypothetical protein
MFLACFSRPSVYDDKLEQTRRHFAISVLSLIRLSEEPKTRSMSCIGLSIGAVTALNKQKLAPRPKAEAAKPAEENPPAQLRSTQIEPKIVNTARQPPGPAADGVCSEPDEGAHTKADGTWEDKL